MSIAMQSLTPQALSGHWTLASFVYRWPDGRELAPLGDVQGHLIYLMTDERPDRMAVQVVSCERPPLDPTSEASLALHFRSGFAYGGRWSLAGSTVHHEVESSSLAFWQGVSLAREVTLDNDRLQLSTDEPSPQLPEGGYQTVLEWRR